MNMYTADNGGYRYCLQHSCGAREGIVLWFTFSDHFPKAHRL